MQFLTLVCQNMSMNFHGLVHIWIVGTTHKIIPSLSMIRYGMELDYFTREQNKYNDMGNIMKILDRESNRGGGWEREWSSKNLVFCIGTFRSILIHQQKQMGGDKGGI